MHGMLLKYAKDGHKYLCAMWTRMKYNGLIVIVSVLLSLSVRNFPLQNNCNYSDELRYER
jgi:hypothetical protein